MRLKESLVVVRKRPLRRGACRGGRGGRGRRTKRVQPIAQTIDPTAPVTYAGLAAMEQRFRELSVEAKHLRDFRKYNPRHSWVFGGPHQGSDVVVLFGDHISVYEVPRGSESLVHRFHVDRQRHCLVGDDREDARGLRDAKRQEFLNLEQVDRTVEQYDAKFDMLSRFAPEMIATEATRADKFVRGLRLDIQGRGSTSEQKRKAEQQPISVPQRNFRSGGEFRRLQQKPFEVGEVAKGKPLCTTYGKHHLSRCLFGTRTCFKCRQEEHTADRCPLRLAGGVQNQGAGAPHQGKVFAINKTEAERAGTVVAGTLLMLGHYALVLFDSGSSHSFISSAFVLHARLEIEIARHVIEVTLLVLDMHDFKMILGMDWLAANHVSIDCSRKEVAFNTPLMASFKFKGEGSRSLPKVISAMRANKLLCRGTWNILASMVDTREVDENTKSAFFPTKYYQHKHNINGMNINILNYQSEINSS
ncbi:gag protease polyprotein [Cucumis melo var. makuwa]|uniref:Gag protease polyprotein n=1 Tax=Cucumis melo var. makuwa TaxID=1194695 RepID=A0A5A7SGX1_CUCMM|nr:gag protease polyprotein [Cucumis melo var. makuwa]